MMVDQAKWQNIRPREVAGKDGWRIIDVREPHEYVGELGHIAGAELVPLATVPQAARTWDPDAKYLLVCRSGGRSAQAANYLASQGFENLLNLEGGMMAWNQEGLPTSREAEAKPWPRS